MSSGPRPPATSTDRIEIADAQGNVREVALDQPKLVIGRSLTTDIVLEHAKISRKHAELIRDDRGIWHVKDLASANGTRVNGLPVSERALRSGDVVQIADFALTVRCQTRQSDEYPATRTLTLSNAPAESIRQLREFTAPKLDASHMTSLMDFGEKLLECESPDERIRMLCSLMITQLFRGWWAQMLRVSAAESSAMPTELCPPEINPAYQSQTTPLSQRLLRAAIESEQPALASNLSAGMDSPAAMTMTLSPQVAAISAVACPLRRLRVTEGSTINPTASETDAKIGDSSSENEATVDLLYVIFPPSYGTVEWLMLVTLAVEQYRQAEASWKARQEAETHAALQRDLQMGQEIQKGLLPRDLDVADIELSMDFQPSRGVAGDYLDIVPTRDGRVLLVVADVCGKGLQAALVSASLHSMVHAAIRTGSELAELATAMNEHLCDYLPEGSFVTMVAILVDPASGAMQCVNAGHPPVFVVQPDGSHRELASALNMPLGIYPDAMMAVDEQLEPGEVMLLYTDGLTEITNLASQMLGEERLAQELATAYREQPASTLDALRNRIRALLTEFARPGPPDDDRTFMLARRREPSTAEPSD